MEDLGGVERGLVASWGLGWLVLGGWFGGRCNVVSFNTVIEEELLFRGVVLPRMKCVFGRRDWIAFGALFAVYYLHQPGSIPNSLVEGVFPEAYPSRRYHSA